MVESMHKEELVILDDLIQQEEENIAKLADALKQTRVNFLPYEPDAPVAELADARESLMTENIDLERDLEDLSAHILECEEAVRNAPDPIDNAKDPEEDSLIDEVLRLRGRIKELNSQIDFRERILLMKKPE